LRSIGRSISILAEYEFARLRSRAMVRATRESIRRLTRKDRTHRARRWGAAGAAAVLAVGAAASLVSPGAGVIAAVASATALLLGALGRDLAIVRAELSEHRALIAISPLCDNLVYLGNPAVLCPENALFVIQQIRRRRPARVLEFGSGASTVLIARALRQLGEEARIDSLEHSEEWYQRTRELVRAAGVGDVVRLHHSPLGSRGGIETPWYDLGVLAGDAGPFDLVLADGPAGGSRDPLSRLGGFLSVRGQLSPGAAILLDDGLRAGECEIVRRWQEADPRLRASFHKSDTGMWLLELPAA
jgi:predicted O-methyltransferase YrrM